MKNGPASLIWGMLLVGAAASFAQTAAAATLYIDPYTSSLNRGDSESLAIRLDVDEAAGECINTVDAVVEYSGGIEPVDISIGDSIFNVWVEQPTINREDRTITFAGGIPNGYCGRVIGDPRLTNVLAEVVFQLPGFSIGGSGSDLATVSFADLTTAYLNDGRGTKAPLTTYGAEIALGTKPGATLQNPWQEEVDADNIPPEEFSIFLQKDEKAFSQKYYIVFSTTDKQTGIDHYEVLEEPLSMVSKFQWGRADAPWIETRSPYVLKDQTLNSAIYVKAVDKAGNEYIAKLEPDAALRTALPGQNASLILVATGVITLLLIGLILFTFLRKSRRKSRPAAAAGDAEVKAEESEETSADVVDETK